MEEESGSEARVRSRSGVQKLSLGSQVSGGQGRESSGEPGGPDTALRQERGCCGWRPSRARGLQEAAQGSGLACRKAQRRKMGARGSGQRHGRPADGEGLPFSPSPEPSSGRPAGPLGGPEWTAVLAWVWVSPLPPDQASQEAGLPEALRTPGLVQWSAGLRLDVQKQEALGWQGGLETSFSGMRRREKGWSVLRVGGSGEGQGSLLEAGACVPPSNRKPLRSLVPPGGGAGSTQSLPATPATLLPERLGGQTDSFPCSNFLLLPKDMF